MITRILRTAMLVYALLNALLFTAAGAVMTLAVIDLPLVTLTPGVGIVLATTGILGFFWVKFFVGQLILNEFKDAK